MRVIQDSVRRKGGELFSFAALGETCAHAQPSTAQRTSVAIAGIACGIALFITVLPPSHSKRIPERPTVGQVLADAMRALTGMATSSAIEADRSTAKGPAGGIRN